MTSEVTSAGQAYVWVWLPGVVDPVVAGVLAPTVTVLQGEPVLAFRYAASYRARAEAVSLFIPELPPRARGSQPGRRAPP